MVHISEMTNEVLASILKSIDEGIHVINTEGITIFYNEVAARHDGMHIDEVLGKPLLEVFPSLNKETSTLYKVLLTKKPIYNQPQTYLNKHSVNIETINTTLPIFVKEEFIGAVEIAKDYSRMKLLSERLLELQNGLTPNKKVQLKSKNTKFTLEDLITRDENFIEMKEKAYKLAQSDSPILVYGESGTGKELLVQGIHHASRRTNGPFIAQNCAAIPEALLESLLFGTAKGSYTGALDRPGLFELAHEGTLFLDELHTMPIELQAKLLRVLEDGMVRRVGGSKSFSVDVRIVAAMNEHPRAALANQNLRSDLFYRLNVLMFELVPLRNRKDDILILTVHFIQQFNLQLGKKINGITREVELLFLQHQWPGNVRELKHCIEYMMNICEGQQLTSNDLPSFFKQNINQKRKSGQKYESLSLRKNVQQLESTLISEALAISAGNINQAAKLLEIPRQTLQYKLQKSDTPPTAE
ncbi:sigma-54 interaction domain-containing protein [Bacillus sp. CGMCC 1.16607]|uniref:sigma-54 interaction domain-containing protein n=1 Tax=Bacillus sp. CGMCC 1.16607 TaxID=3351842 RepID=UPI003626E378